MISNVTYDMYDTYDTKTHVYIRMYIHRKTNTRLPKDDCVQVSKSNLHERYRDNVPSLSYLVKVAQHISIQFY